MKHKINWKRLAFKVALIGLIVVIVSIAAYLLSFVWQQWLPISKLFLYIAMGFVVAILVIDVIAEIDKNRRNGTTYKINWAQLLPKIMLAGFIIAFVAMIAYVLSFFWIWWLIISEIIWRVAMAVILIALIGELIIIIKNNRRDKDE